MATWRISRNKIYREIIEVSAPDGTPNEDLIDMVDRGNFTTIADDEYQYMDDYENWSFDRIPSQEELRAAQEAAIAAREARNARRARPATPDEVAAAILQGAAVIRDPFAPAINREVDARRAASLADTTMEDVRFDE